MVLELSIASESAIITFWIIVATSPYEVLGKIPPVLLQEKNLQVRILLSQYCISLQGFHVG